MGKTATYSLRQVVNLTGISEFTLRGWELRYNAFSPRRSPTGRRRYLENDLKKAMLLRELLKREHRIGDIAGLSVRKLSSLFESAAAETYKRSEARRTLSTKISVRPEVSRLIQSASLQEWDQFERILHRCKSADIPEVVFSVVLPAVEELSRLVGLKQITISQEHVFSSLIKEFLYCLKSGPQKHSKSERFVVASPEGDFHELGILLASTLLSHYKLSVLYLGPNTPKSEVCETAIQYRATRVVIGSTSSLREGAREDLLNYVHFIDHNLPQNVGIWLGGKNSSNLHIQLERPYTRFASFIEFDEAVRNL